MPHWQRSQQEHLTRVLSCPRASIFQAVVILRKSRRCNASGISQTSIRIFDGGCRNLPSNLDARALLVIPVHKGIGHGRKVGKRIKAFSLPLRRKPPSPPSSRTIYTSFSNALSIDISIIYRKNRNNQLVSQKLELMYLDEKQLLTYFSRLHSTYK